MLEEAQRLLPRVGELPDGGPDKFLLAVLYYTVGAPLRIASLGPTTVREHHAGRDVYEYGTHPAGATSRGRALALLRSSLQFVWDTLAFRPTIVLCGIDGPFAIGVWLAARLTSARLVFLAHTALALPTLGRAQRWANNWMSRHSDLVIAHGPYVKDEAIELGSAADRTVEFNNGLDPDHRKLIASLPVPAAGARKNRLLYVGRMEEDKGVIDLFEAFSALPAALGLQLQFIGTGGATAALQQRIAAAGLADRVILSGSVSHEEVFRAMREAFVVVTPSQSRFPEGFCKSAMEAFYVGTPVIAPDYGPFPYMVEHDVNGLLYEADSVPALTSSLRKLAEDTALYDRLAEGAVQAGIRMSKPETTFARAVEIALAPALRKAGGPA